MTRRTIHVHPEPPIERDGRLRVAARIEGLERRPESLWFDLAPERRADLTDLADPFVLALLFPAMETGAALHVHGAVSRGLLLNLESFQNTWHYWRDGRYSVVDLIADREISSPAHDGGSIVMFSGGLDSAYTLFRRKRGLLGPRAQRVTAALLVLGFDIPLEDEDQFPTVVQAARAMLDVIGVELWTLATNYRAFTEEWEDAHATALAACLHLLSGRANSGVIAGSTYWKPMFRPWGSNPLTDPWLSGDRMTIVHDAGEILRLHKPALVSQWPEAMAHLRVCYASPARDRNCGKCTKCVLTQLAFMANGLPLPATLMPPPTKDQIRRINLQPEWGVSYARTVLEIAARNGLKNAAWTSALRSCVMRNGPVWRKARSRLRWSAPPR